MLGHRISLFQILIPHYFGILLHCLFREFPVISWFLKYVQWKKKLGVFRGVILYYTEPSRLFEFGVATSRTCRLRSKIAILRVFTFTLQKWRRFAQNWGPCMPFWQPLMNSDIFEDSTSKTTPKASPICLNWLKHLKCYWKSPYWVSIVPVTKSKPSQCRFELKKHLRIRLF